MNNVCINDKYKPVFRKRAGTRYFVITGGRGSGKTYATALAVLTATYQDSLNILYTRYTLVSAETSIIPEFKAAMETMGVESDFHCSGNTITNLVTGARIYFRGILTSSGIQTAKLKSIPKIKWWIMDEAEEMVDENLFDTIDLSLRHRDADIRVMLILNPPEVYGKDGIEHFIYRRFFKERAIQDGFCGVVDDTTYIHTTYKDNYDNLDESFLEKAHKCYLIDRRKYRHIYLGYWGMLTEGIIYKDWMQTDTFPDYLPTWYGVDWGYTNDPSAVVRIAYCEAEKAIYLHQVLYQNELQPMQIAEYIRRDILTRRRRISPRLVCDDERVIIEGEDIGSIYEDYGDRLTEQEARELNRVVDLFGEVYCDPARPEHIAELRRMGLSAIPADNTDKSGRVEYMKYFHVYYTSESPDIQREQRGYRYKPTKLDKTKFTNVPEDGNDHCMDAANYGTVTHLRRMGITNIINES